MSVPGVRFSVRVNNDLSFAELLALAEAAERAGFDQLWVSNDLFLRSAPVLAGALAARTGRIGLGIAIMNPYSVHVSELAMAAATVQEVSGGRFLLGLGAGAAAGPGRREVDLPACFWVSLSGDPAAARAALAEKLAYYGPSIPAEVLAPAGLRPQDFGPAAALAHGGQAAAGFIDDRMLALGVAGDAADVLARCRALRRLGARHLSFGPPLGPDPAAAIRLLGEAVLPALNSEEACWATPWDCT